MEGAYVLGSPFVEDLVAAGQRGPSHPGGHPSVAEDTAVKGLWAAYVHWPGPPAASLKMWSPADQSSQSHPGGHPPVAEDTAVKGLWGSVGTWAGGPRCVVASGRRDHLDVPVVCFLRDYGLWWEGLFPMVRWSRWTRGSALVLGVIFGGGRVTRRCGAVVGEETSSLPSSS